MPRIRSRSNQYFEVLGSVRVEQYKFKQNAPLAAAAVQNLERNDNLVELAGRRRLPSDAQQQRLRDARHVVQSVRRQPLDQSGHQPPATALSLIQLAPEKNETTEVGVKADVLGGKLSLASAMFHTEKTNLRVPDPANIAVTILAGEVERQRLRSERGRQADGAVADHRQLHLRPRADHEDDRGRSSSTPSR